MDGPKFEKFNQSFQAYKRGENIEHDTGGILEGLWNLEQRKNMEMFEKQYPGIREAFDGIISLLPDADKPEKDEYPFAAAVVRIGADGTLETIVRSGNRVNQLGDSTQHAELAVLQEAQKKIGSKHLDGMILLSTAQPCEMCAGAVRNTQIGAVVYGVSQKDLEGTHVEFKEGFKPVRTVPAGVDIDAMLGDSGVNVFAGYKKDEVLQRLQRTVGTFNELYRDPDAKL